jgi:hypothetical protein
LLPLAASLLSDRKGRKAVARTPTRERLSLLRVIRRLPPTGVTGTPTANWSAYVLFTRLVSAVGI